MATCEAPAGDVVRPLPPDLEEARRLARRIRLPREREHWTGNLPAGAPVLAVLLVVDRRATAVVLARGMDDRRIAERVAIRAPGVGRKREAGGRPCPEEPGQEEVG